jgi:hypothetical protein
MKKWIALLLAVMMCLSLCACGGQKKQQTESGEEQTTETAEPAQTEDAGDAAESSKATEGQLKSFRDEKLAALAAKYLDLSHYHDSLTLIGDEQDLTIGTVKVNGTAVAFGLTLDELKAAGITPVHESFAESTLNSLIIFDMFQIASGDVLQVGFQGSDTVGTDGIAVMIGTYSRGDGSETLAPIAVDDLETGMPISEAIKLYGEPYQMRDGNIAGEKVLQMEYYSADGSQALTVYVSPETELVVGLVAQSAK